VLLVRDGQVITNNESDRTDLALGLTRRRGSYLSDHLGHELMTTAVDVFPVVPPVQAAQGNPPEAGGPRTRRRNAQKTSQQPTLTAHTTGAVSGGHRSYFHRNVFLTFVAEGLGPHRTRAVVGAEDIMWSTDFPHPVTSWPSSKKIIEEQFQGIPAGERDLMRSGNVARVWDL
jgi:hypothetical protein